MNLQPTLIQELETAKILQELSQRSVDKTTAKLSPGATKGESKRHGLKRKHWATDAGTPYSLNHSPLAVSSAVASGRPVSPGTDNESSVETSSCASLPLHEAPFKPLCAPPKLGKIAFKKTGRPTSSSTTIHPSPVRTNARTNVLNKSSLFTLPSSYNSNVTPISATKAMMFQLMSNPMLSTGSILPICLPTSITEESCNIQPNFASKVLTSKLTTGTTSSNKRKLCRMDDCNEEAARRTPYCKNHCGQRKCEFQGCKKCAQGRTRFCISHGGGRRCKFQGCTKGARDKQFCASHGGGRRCNVELCTKLAVGRGSTCTAHGGGRRCQDEGCTKSAQSSSDYCVRHGGGRKCRAAKCSKVARGKLGLCMSHATQQEIKMS